MKALAKDRARRYESAGGLARDLERYLNDEPGEAGPPSAAYRLRKLVRRHKGPVLDHALPDQPFSGPGVHSYTVPATTFLDLDNNALTYSARLVSGGALPAWLSFNPATRTFSGNPAPGDASPLQLRVTADDGQGRGIADDFQLTLVNVSEARTFTVTGFPSPSTAGQAGTFTVTARDQSGNVATDYRGTVHFSSSDPVATLPAHYTFTAADNGVHTFANGVTLYVAGTQTVTATDTVTATLTGTASATVRPGPVALYYVYPGSELATTVTRNVPTAIYIFLFDQYYNWITNYAGTIAFYTPDPLGEVPPNYTFTGTEGGIGVPGAVTFGTLGLQELYVWDHPGVTVFGYAQYDVRAGAAPGGGSPGGVVAALSTTTAVGTWARRFADLVADLCGTGTGPRAHGDTFFKGTGPDGTVSAAGAVEVLRGAAGRDRFFAALSGGLLDVLDALGGPEIVEELSVLAR